MKRLFSAVAVLAVAASSSAFAAKLTTADVMKSYDKTDKVESCVQLQRIDHTDILDTKNILFTMLDGKRYLNTLPVQCSGLTPYRAFSYKTSLNMLCNTDIITVFEPGLPHPNSFGSCGLGHFTLLQKKPGAPNKLVPGAATKDSGGAAKE
jgi:hypothetical protein